MIPVIATILVLYPAFFFLSKKYQALSKFHKWVNAFSVGIFITTVIFSTGGLLSPFFFLTYFLIFTTAIASGVRVAITITAVILIAFLFTPRIDLLEEAVQFFSLLLMIPIVVYLGHVQEKQKRAEETIQAMKDEQEIVNE